MATAGRTRTNRRVVYETLRRKVLTLELPPGTGLSENVIRSLFEHLSERAKALDLWLPAAERARLITELSTYVTALCMNRLYKGDFVIK